MQSLSLNSHSDSSSRDIGPGPHNSAGSQPQNQHDPNQYSTYDSYRDSTAQPANAWQHQQYVDYDPYYYSSYGEYYNQDPEEAQLGDDWDQLGFAAGSASPQHDSLSPRNSAKPQTAGRKPSEQQLCSHFQVSGECPRDSACHLAHGDLCEVSFAVIRHLHCHPWSYFICTVIHGHSVQCQEARQCLVKVNSKVSAHKMAQ